MELPEFMQLRLSLRQLAAMLRSAEMDLNVYSESIQQVANATTTGVSDSKHRKSLEAALIFLEEHGQASSLLAWHRREHQHPNLTISIPGTFFHQLLRSNRKLSMPINEHNAGFQISGSGEADVSIKASSLDNSQQIDLAIVGSGKAPADVSATTTVGKRKKHQARVMLHTETDINISVPISINRQFGLSIGDPNILVPTIATVSGAEFDARLRIIQQLGRNRIVQEANKRLGQIEQQAESKLKLQIQDKLLNAIHEFQDIANSAIDGWVIRALNSTDNFPQLDLSSSSARVEAKARFTGPIRPAALAAFDCSSDSITARICLHESMINNNAAMLDGQTVDDETILSKVFGKIFRQPEEDIDPGAVISRLHFADHDGLRAYISSQGMRLTLQLAGFEYLGKTYAQPLSIQADYLLSSEGSGGIYLQRDGQIIFSSQGETVLASTLTKLQAIMQRILVPRARALTTEFSVQLQDKARKIPVKIEKLNMHDTGWMDIRFNVLQAE
jgi:hypothetical protein